MAKQFFCNACRGVGGCTLEDPNDWSAAPAYCPYDRERAKWREVVVAAAVGSSPDLNLETYEREMGEFFQILNNSSDVAVAGVLADITTHPSWGGPSKTFWAFVYGALLVVHDGGDQ